MTLPNLAEDVMVVPEGCANAVMHPAVSRGSCVLVDDADGLVYAGPLLGCPDVTGYVVLMHRDDYVALRVAFKQQRH